MRSLYTTTLIAILSTEAVFAFPDKYEADNSAEKAQKVTVNAPGQEGEQHTLHKNSDGSLDEDWFKFSATENADYDIETVGVGSDIQIRLQVYTADEEFHSGVKSTAKGEATSLHFVSKVAGDYYLRVSDLVKPSEDCRTNMQYTLSITDRAAGSIQAIQIKGQVFDALSGRRLDNATVNLNCKPREQFCCPPTGFCSETEETIIDGERVRRKSVSCAPENVNEDGSYELNIGSVSGGGGVDSCRKELNDPVEIAVWQEGYKPLTCRFYVPSPLTPEEDVVVFENISLFPEDEKMFNPVPTQANGKLQLGVNFPQGCTDYYVGMLQPDGAFFILPEKNSRQPFSEGSLKFLSWRNVGNTALDLPVADLPRGEYQFYFLRTAKGSDPMEYLNKYPDDLGVFVYSLK